MHQHFRKYLYAKEYRKILLGKSTGVLPATSILAPEFAVPEERNPPLELMSQEVSELVVRCGTRSEMTFDCFLDAIFRILSDVVT